jgi:hypothetical protein
MADTAAESLWRRVTTPGTPTLGIEGATLASSAVTSLAITSFVHAVSGVAAQVLMDIPYIGFAGVVALRPTGIFTWVTGAAGATATSRGFGLAGTAVVGKILYMTYVPSTGLWYPNYIA